MDRSMTRGRQAGIVLVVGLMVMSAIAASTKVQPQPSAHGREAPSIFDGILGNVAGSPEMSTAELRAALTEPSVIVLDARPYEEYAVSHIPGARAVPPKAGTTPALYVGDAAEVAKSIPDKTQPLILYCNGLFCGRSERLEDDLTQLGYRNVRRYQLGAPGWRALGGVMQVESGVAAAARAGCDLGVDRRESGGRWEAAPSKRRIDTLARSLPSQG